MLQSEQVRWRNKVDPLGTNLQLSFGFYCIHHFQGQNVIAEYSTMFENPHSNIPCSPIAAMPPPARKNISH